LAIPEPVHDVGPMGLGYDLAPQVGDGGKVHPNGNLETTRVSTAYMLTAI